MNIDSETPSSPRHTRRKAPLGEKPESTVNVLQPPTLPAISAAFEKRSPAMPARGEHAPYTHKKRAPVRPSTASLYPNSFCSAGKRLYTTCLSAWLSE